MFDLQSPANKQAEGLYRSSRGRTHACRPRSKTAGLVSPCQGNPFASPGKPKQGFFKKKIMNDNETEGRKTETRDQMSERLKLTQIKPSNVKTN